MAFPTCSFCGRHRKGGVAGPTPTLYIRPDCIRLAGQLLNHHEQGPPEDGAPIGA